MRRNLASLIVMALLTASIGAGTPIAEVSRAQEIKARVFKLLTEGVQAYREGRPKEAIPLLREAAAIALNSFRAYYFLGLALKDDRRYLEAIEPLRIAIELDPTSLQARVALGDCYLKRGDPTEAMAEYQRTLSSQDDYAPAIDGLGRAAEASGDDLKAAEHYRRAIDLNPGFPDASLNLGDLYMRQGRYGEAIDLFLGAIKVRPDFAAAHNRLGVCYAKQRLANEAIAALRHAATLETGNPWHPVEIGTIFLDLDNLVQARREFDKAIDLDPDYLPAYMGMARLLRREGRHAEAVDLIARGLASGVDDPGAVERAREMMVALEKEAAREADLEAAIAGGDRRAGPLVALAEAKAGRGDHEGAVALLEEALARSPGDGPPPEVLDRLGYSAWLAGLYGRSAEAYAALSAADAGNPDTWINLGLARTRLGDRAGAETALREASRLRPGDPRPLAYLGNLYVITGSPGRAVGSLEAALALMGEGAPERRAVERLLSALRAGDPGGP